MTTVLLNGSIFIVLDWLVYLRENGIAQSVGSSLKKLYNVLNVYYKQFIIVVV